MFYNIFSIFVLSRYAFLLTISSFEKFIPSTIMYYTILIVDLIIQVWEKVEDTYFKI